MACEWGPSLPSGTCSTTFPVKPANVSNLVRKKKTLVVDVSPNANYSVKPSLVEDARDCSKIFDDIYLSGNQTASDLLQLQQIGITHIVNCAGSLCGSPFQNSFEYRTLFLDDNPYQDIITALYETITFVETARKKGGKILLHCLVGSSRAAALCIGYLMWRHHWTYEDSFHFVHSRRSRCDPNLGFICQLKEWHAWRVWASDPKLAAGTLLFSVDQDGSHADVQVRPVTSLLAGRVVYHEESCYVLRDSHFAYLWLGSRCSKARLVTGEHLISLLLRAEPYFMNLCLKVVHQGEEDEAFLRCKESAMLVTLISPCGFFSPSTTCCTSTCTSPLSPSSQTTSSLPDVSAFSFSPTDHLEPTDLYS
eukprot:GILJ01003423.1.p1 GENE.GILJ01003423.1~~GILJ01003423.1.p1  ORF type:complete len:365 (+),score=14.93 GILJ01003423.1:96-1190(+)